MSRSQNSKFASSVSAYKVTNEASDVKAKVTNQASDVKAILNNS